VRLVWLGLLFAVGVHCGVWGLALALALEDSGVGLECPNVREEGNRPTGLGEVATFCNYGWIRGCCLLVLGLRGIAVRNLEFNIYFIFYIN
jgi:hypothetical protein